MVSRRGKGEGLILHRRKINVSLQNVTLAIITPQGT